MENIIEKKSFDFAVRIVRLYKYLCDKKKEFVLSEQLLRSGQVSAQTLLKRNKHKVKLISFQKFLSL